MKEFKKQEKVLDDARLAEEKDDADAALNEVKEKKRKMKESLDKANGDFERFEQKKMDLETELEEWQYR